jgi:hypothetical protein
MTVRRFAVWIVSAALGIVGAVGMAFAFVTTFERFSYATVFLVFISLASLASIWLDHSLKTRYLRR